MINVWNGKWSIDNGSQNTSHEWVSVCVCECVSLCVCGCVCFCVFLLDSVRISDLLSVGFWNFGSFLRVWYTMQLWHAIPCAPYLRAINQGVYTIFLWKISYRRWFEAFLEIVRIFGSVRALALKISHWNYFKCIPRTHISLDAKFWPNREWLHF